MVEINAEHLQQYEEEGYCLVRGLIPAAEIEAVRDRSLEVAVTPPAWGARHFQVLDPARLQAEGGGALAAGIQRPATQEAVFAAVAEHPRLAAAMAALLRGPVDLYTDQVGVKHGALEEEQGGCSYFHQDSWYWKIAPHLGCNCWIPLTEVGPGASALAVMPGSQAGWKLTEHESYFDDPPMGQLGEEGFTPFKRHRIPDDRVDFAREALVHTRPGDGLFFTNYTWHRSEPNRSGLSQAFYAIAYSRRAGADA